MPVVEVKVADLEPCFPELSATDAAADGALAASIEKLGVLETVLAYRSQGTLRLAHGHRRLAVAVKLGLPMLPARVTDPLSPQDALLRYAQENIRAADKNDLWKIVFVKKAVELGFSRAEISERILPIIGMRPSAATVEKILVTGTGLFDALAADLAAGRLDLHRAAEIRAFGHGFSEPAVEDGSLQRTFHAVVRRLALNGQEIKKLARDLTDIANRDDRPLAGVVADPELTEALTVEDPRVRVARFKRALRRLRMPDLAARERGLERIVADLGLPAEARFSFPGEFENDRIEFSFRGDRASALIEAAQKIVSAPDELARIFAIAGGEE